MGHIDFRTCAGISLRKARLGQVGLKLKTLLCYRSIRTDDDRRSERGNKHNFQNWQGANETNLSQQLKTCPWAEHASRPTLKIISNSCFSNPFRSLHKCLNKYSFIAVVKPSFALAAIGRLSYKTKIKGCSLGAMSLKVKFISRATFNVKTAFGKSSLSRTKHPPVSFLFRCVVA